MGTQRARDRWLEQSMGSLLATEKGDERKLAKVGGHPRRVGWESHVEAPVPQGAPPLRIPVKRGRGWSAGKSYILTPSFAPPPTHPLCAPAAPCPAAGTDIQAQARVLGGHEGSL